MKNSPLTTETGVKDETIVQVLDSLAFFVAPESNSSQHNNEFETWL